MMDGPKRYSVPATGAPKRSSVRVRLESMERTLKRLQFQLLRWSPKERAMQAERLRWRLQPIANQMRFAIKAQDVWDDWLERRRQSLQTKGEQE
jgi:hypothetical protein